MKLNLDRETLLKPLQMVIGVVERKQTMPILSNVLLTIEDNKLSVTGTDTEVELIGHSSTPQVDMTSTSLTLPGRKLMDICRALPENAAIELYKEKEKVVLKSGRSRFSLSTLPAKDFPNTNTQVGSLAFTLPQHQLKQLLQRTYFAMAQQDVRYYLNGLLLEIHPNKIIAVATDGHRLALSSTDITTNASSKMQIIVPRKGVLELLRLLEDDETDIGITLSSGHIHIATNEFMFTSKLIEGRFPDYEQVIPRNGDKRFEINRDELKQALQRSAILCNEKYKGVRLEIDNGILKITTNNPEQESAEEELVIDYNNSSIDIGFNVNYLLDVLNIVKNDSVNFTFTGSSSSVLLEECKDDWGSLFVIMPMRL